MNTCVNPRFFARSLFQGLKMTCGCFGSPISATGVDYFVQVFGQNQFSKSVIIVFNKSFIQFSTKCLVEV